MEEAGSAIVFPSRQDILRLNRWHIDTTGGFHDGRDNLLNGHSLEWVLDAIQYPLFDPDPYPTIVEKAALLSWVIIDGHVFNDGNKRTGISSLEIIIGTNGFYMDASVEEAEAVALAIARGKEYGYSLEEFIRWVRERIHLNTDRDHVLTSIWIRASLGPSGALQ